MSSRQHSVSRVFSMKKSRSSKKRKLTTSTAATSPPSPLLLRSEEAPSAQDCPCSHGITSTDGTTGDCKEDMMQECSELWEFCCKYTAILYQIMELCNSPRSSRYSIFSPAPRPPPESQHRNHLESLQSSDLSEPSQHEDTSELSLRDDLSESSQCKDLSDDDSPMSSLENTPRPSIAGSPVAPTDCRRYMVINEIISTEIKYTNNLNTILSIFLPAFEHVVAPRALRLLIPAQLEMLVEAHQEILTRLKQRVDNGSKFYGIVGDIFAHLCDSNAEFFSMYRVYMGEFKLALRTLLSHEKESPQFREILTLLQQGPLCERLSLTSYLLTPIQRLPRYELLLKELMKHTPLDHPDSYYVGEALAKLHKEMTKLNISIKSCQMACPTSKKNSFRFKSGRKPLSVLKRFVSAANIDDYSSGDNSYTTDDLLKPPSLKLSRRRRGLKYASSFCSSDADLTSSAGAQNMFRRQTLVHSHLAGYNRAVSCSDLIVEVEDDTQQEQKTPIKFRLLTPLASEVCTPESSRHSRSSYMYSSNSSLSSTDSNKDSLREESLTPTQVDTPSSHLIRPPPTFCSTPAGSTPSPSDQDSRDSTLKLIESFRLEEEEEEGVLGDESNNGGGGGTDNKHSSKNTSKNTSWRLSIFKKRRKANGRTSNEIKYIHQ